MIRRIEQYFLHLLLRYPQLDLLELKTRALAVWSREGIGENIIEKVLFILKLDGLIAIEEEETPEFRKCLESVEKDKRIKNPRKYCKERYPVPMRAMITELGKIRYLHNIYCFSLEQGDSHLNALENMKRASKDIGFPTIPPDKC